MANAPPASLNTCPAVTPSSARTSSTLTPRRGVPSGPVMVPAKRSVSLSVRSSVFNSPLSTIPSRSVPMILSVALSWKGLSFASKEIT